MYCRVDVFTEKKRKNKLLNIEIEIDTLFKIEKESDKLLRQKFTSNNKKFFTTSKSQSYLSLLKFLLDT